MRYLFETQGHSRNLPLHDMLEGLDLRVGCFFVALEEKLYY
jgi:hypothetical protein